jgi:YspA, cpYpsA-related SLOG family
MKTFLITGSRDFDEYKESHVKFIWDILDRYAEGAGPELIMINGGARGADTICQSWAVERGVQCNIYPAQWDNFGRAAGPIRNKKMVEALLEAEGTDVLAFANGALADSRGTRNCVEHATVQGLKPQVFVYEERQVMYDIGL